MSEELPPCGTNPQVELKRIRSILPRFVSDLKVDLDSLAADIWIELWQTNKAPLVLFVKARATDALRNYYVRQKHERQYQPQQDAPPIERIEEDNVETTGSIIDAQAQINKIMALSSLNDLEKRLMYMRFYRGMDGSEIAVVLGEHKSMTNRRIADVIRKLRNSAFTLEQQKDNDHVE